MRVQLGPQQLASGAVLDEVHVSLQSWGTLNAARDNVVLVLHALTGDSHVTGPAGPGHPSPGWWQGMIGPGAALDTNTWCVVAPNVLGGCRGSTGPSSPGPDGHPWGSRFPTVTIRDQVNTELALVDALGLDSVAAVVGGSMGGMRALEWAVGHPSRTRCALVLATGARATADQIATQSAQVLAITADPDWQGGDYHGTGRAPRTGLGLARRIAHLTYRAEAELDERFAHHRQPGDPSGRFAVQSYLDHQADKLVARFDAGSYVHLTDAMNTHDVGAGRGGVGPALAATDVPVVVGGIDSDRLYPLRLQAEIADGLPGCDGLRVISSRFGHDGFLLEVDAVSALLRETVARA
ncbi:MAG: homoserine O-acetyltransferase [Mycobacteriaceae bacterium]